jgi:hypothetical protein
MDNGLGPGFFPQRPSDSVGARVHPIAGREPAEDVTEGQFVYDGGLAAHHTAESNHQAEQHLQPEGRWPEDGDTQIKFLPHGLQRIVGVAQLVRMPLVEFPPGVARVHGFV